LRRPLDWCTRDREPLPIDPSAQHLAACLKRLKSLRGPASEAPPRLAEVKSWQARRLARTYADLAAQPRYRDATAFFLDEVYGEKDFSARDQEMLRIVPVMARILPASAVQTAGLAVELEALTEELDQGVARHLEHGEIDEASYAKACRAASPRRERDRQVALVRAVGERLDTLVGKPLVGHTLKLMGKPARLAGLSGLQDFLERGFAAFREMDGAGEFLATFERREAGVLDRIYGA
jgi:hypothetical protein